VRAEVVLLQCGSLYVYSLLVLLEAMQGCFVWEGIALKSFVLLLCWGCWSWQQRLAAATTRQQRSAWSAGACGCVAAARVAVCYRERCKGCSEGFVLVSFL
jgi:hypothetical protein